jgi:hypothetical protein
MASSASTSTSTSAVSLSLSSSIVTVVEHTDELDNGPCVSLSDDLLRSVLESVSTIAISGTLYLDPQSGLSCQVTDRFRDFLVEVQLAPTAFDWYDVPESRIYPVYFETLLKFVATRIPKGYSIRWWIDSRCWQGYHLKLKKTTKIYHIKSEDMHEKLVNSPFQPSIKQRFTHVAQMSRSEFSRQIELGLFDPVMVQIGICRGKLFFYCENDGRGQVLIPCTNLNDNDKELHRHGIDTTLHHSCDAEQTPGCFLQATADRGTALVQVHSLRYLTFICRSKQVSDQVAIALSATDGMIVSFALKRFGNLDVDRNGVLEESSYIRFRLHTARKRGIQPLPSMLRDKLGAVV